MQQFGLYGNEYPFIAPEANWNLRKQFCSISPSTKTDKKETSATTQLSPGVSATQTGILQMPSSAPDGNDQELRAELRQLLITGLPERKLSPNKFEKLVVVHKRLRESQYQLAERYQRAEIVTAQYLELIKQAAHSADKEGELILGYDDYHRVFGPPDTIEQIYDLKAF